MEVEISEASGDALCRAALLGLHGLDAPGRMSRPFGGSATTPC